MGYIPKPGETDPSPYPPGPLRAERLKQWAFDMFGQKICVGDKVYINCGLFINRSGNVLDMDTVGMIDVLAVQLGDDGTKIIQARHVQFLPLSVNVK
jgi:hypothetical protein